MFKFLKKKKKKPEEPPLLDTPWRDIVPDPEVWTPRTEKLLMESIDKTFDIPDMRANILLLGGAHAGKSSFINTFATICQKRIADVVRSGDSETSLTLKYVSYCPKDGLLKNICLFDCMGLGMAPNDGFNPKDIEYLVNGNILEGYKFDQKESIKDGDPKFTNEPTEEYKLHCVAIVADATTVIQDTVPKPLKKKDNVPDPLNPDPFKTKVLAVLKHLNESDIPTALVLTKIDQICDEVQKDPSKIFRSPRVRDAVKRASEMYRMPMYKIHPVCNYVGLTEPNHVMHHPVLYALKQFAGFAADHIRQTKTEK